MQAVFESTSPGIVAAEKARYDFFRMAVSFSITHGCTVTLLVYATSLLHEHAGLMGNGALYVTTFISALFLATPTVQAIGLRGGLLAGVGLYAAYALFFFLSLLSGSKGPVGVQISLFLLGSVLGGLGAGVMWTAQGGYMTHTAAQITSLTGTPRSEVTTALATNFAVIYLVSEMITRLGYSALQYMGMGVEAICLLYTIVSALSTVLLLTVSAADGSEKDEKRSDPTVKLLDVVKLWPDPKLWLLAPGNITFGFSSAFINGIFISRHVTPTLGEDSVGLLSAAIVLSAAVASPVFGYMGNRWGRGCVVFIGATAFLVIPLLVGGSGDWGFGLVLFFVLQGIGRAVYESTNRAIFSDFFQDAPEGAFANVTLQASISPAVCFFLSDKLQETTIFAMIIVSAVLTMVGYPLACLMQGGAETRPLLRPGASQATA
mmetsp:Transcript_130137/g.236452  ORF Transcript_130137/g.236452 Transcript_130137/m.236452 type:complete len:433 (-) Transcript_130137:101-1399(-)